MKISVCLRLFKTAVCLLACFVLASCTGEKVEDIEEKAEKSVFMKYALTEIQGALADDVEKEYLESFEISDIEITEETEDLVNVNVIYDVIYGNKDFQVYDMIVKCLFSFEKKSGFDYSNCDMSEVKEVERNYQLVEEKNTAPVYYPYGSSYIAEIKKSEVHGMSKEEIAQILIKDWVSQYEEWGENATFLIIDTKNIKAKPWFSTNDKNWGKKEGYADEKPIREGSLNSWLTYCSGEYKYIGFCSNPGLTVYAGGKSFNNDGLWTNLDDYGSASSGNDLVLTEFEDRYTLEPRRNVLKDLQ